MSFRCPVPAWHLITASPPLWLGSAPAPRFWDGPEFVTPASHLCLPSPQPGSLAEPASPFQSWDAKCRGSGFFATKLLAVLQG